MKAPPIAGRARVPPVRPLAPDGERPDDLRREPPHGTLSERPERRPPAVRPVLRGWPHPPGIPPGGRRVRFRDDDVLLDPPRSAPRDPGGADRGPPRVRGPVRDRVLPRVREPRAVREVPPGERARRRGVRVVAGAARAEPPPAPGGPGPVPRRGDGRVRVGARGGDHLRTP